MAKKNKEPYEKPEMILDVDFKDTVSDSDMSVGYKLVEPKVKIDVDVDLSNAKRTVKRNPVKIRKKKPTPKVVPEIKRVEAIIPYRVFEKISGWKWDQMAGFKSYVKRETLGPMTVKKWHEAFQAFLKRPV